MVWIIHYNSTTWELGNSRVPRRRKRAPYVPREIEEFAWDDGNEPEVERHGVLPEQIDELLLHRWKVKRNPHRDEPGRGDWIMIGRDIGGACLQVVIEETSSPKKWRPVTARRCDPEERRLLGND